MVHTLFWASEFLHGDTDMLITYGNVVCEPRVIIAVLACRESVCLVSDREWENYWRVRIDDPLEDAEALKVDWGRRVLELGKKPGGYDEIRGQ